MVVNERFDCTSSWSLMRGLTVFSAEAKNLSAGGGARDTLCKVRFDQEEIFSTSTVEKSHKVSTRTTRMHSSRMRTGRTLTVFRWRTPPQKKTPPENLEEPPTPPKNLEEPPPEDTPPWKFGDPPKKRPPWKIWAKSGAPPHPPPKNLSKIWSTPPCEQNEWQTGVKILPWPKLRFGR